MSTKPNEPSALALARRLRLELELAVRGFARLDRVGVGMVIRAEAFNVVKLAMMAWREPQLRTIHLLDLSRALDGLTSSMQLAQETRAFVSVAQFAAIYRTAAELGQQVGGWYRKQHAKGQNAEAHASSQRAQILSAQAAQLSGAHS